MLKKLILLAIPALVLCSCHDDNNEDGPSGPVDPAAGTAYEGTLDVTPLSDSSFEGLKESDVVFTWRPAGDGSYLLDIPKIKFVTQMPVYISFEVRGIRPEFEGGGFTFALDETVPYRNGAPYDPDGKGTYTIHNLRGESTDGTALHVRFECYTMQVDYRGTKK